MVTLRDEADAAGVSHTTGTAAGSTPRTGSTGDAPVPVAPPALPDGLHPAWLPETAFAPLGRRRVRVLGHGPLVDTVRGEVAAATTRWGGLLRSDDRAPVDLVLAIDPAPARGTGTAAPGETFAVERAGEALVVRAATGHGLLQGLWHVVRCGEAAFATDPGPRVVGTFAPAGPVRMLDHWDNMTVHPVMGQVERGYAGGSLFFSDGRVRDGAADLARVRSYARMLSTIGVNAVAVNNVNVGRTEARLLTDHLPGVALLAEAFRAYGVRLHLSVSFAAPMTVGGLATADPLDPAVQRWWADVTARVYAAVPDFGGYVVKADSEGQPGPFAYGRDHADGANLLARTLAPHGGTVFWRAFVYDHRQDWRDRSTDRARAAYDHFAPLDGRFDHAVVLQVKFGPMDFQTREPVSPVIAAMPRTRLAVEVQVTQEYTGQQKHVCYLGTQWSQVLGFRFRGDGGPSVADVVGGAGGGVVGVSNVGTDEYWTGHPLAQANLYAFGRLAWDPGLAPEDVLDEWARLTFGEDPVVLAALHRLMDDSWSVYESYTAPLGVGFMVTPGSHDGPSVDGYEYSPWGTYHFADRDGIGVDRTVATGTGFAGQYPSPWRERFESLQTCPDELLLFFHHVPWGHRLHSGATVVQHIYDSRWDGHARTVEMGREWAALRGRVPDDVHDRVAERLVAQERSAREWRDQVRTYVHRMSGVPDARGNPIY